MSLLYDTEVVRSSAWVNSVEIAPSSPFCIRIIPFIPSAIKIVWRRSKIEFMPLLEQTFADTRRLFRVLRYSHCKLHVATFCLPRPRKTISQYRMPGICEFYQTQGLKSATKMWHREHLLQWLKCRTASSSLAWKWIFWRSLPVISLFKMNYTVLPRAFSLLAYLRRALAARICDSVHKRPKFLCRFALLSTHSLLLIQ